MGFGRLKQFTFHMYWVPSDESIEVRHIGNLRPPNELVKEAVKLTEREVNDFQSLDENHRTYLGKVNVGFVYFAGEPEQNRIKKSIESFERIMRVEESSTPVGEIVADEYEVRRNRTQTGQYAPYQDEGWLTVNGEYYNTSEDKPDGWSSRQ